MHSQAGLSLRERTWSGPGTDGNNECCYVTIWSKGWAKSEIARALGVSRRTSITWIETGQLERELDDEAVRYTPRPQVQRKIDAFRPIALARLAEYPKLTATRLHAEIRAAGYTGGYTHPKEYVRHVLPMPAMDPVVRFETAPGLQAQSADAWLGAGLYDVWWRACRDDL